MTTMAEQAYQQIKTKVITLELPPATPVDMQELMTQLDVGKAPLREALQRLAFEKLIVISPRRGTFVSDLSIIQLQQAFDARLLLERHTTRIAATRVTEEQITALRDLFNDTDEIANRGDYLAAIMVEYQFHRMIAEISHNEFLLSFLEILLPMILRLWYYVYSQYKDPTPGIKANHQRHLPVIDALASGDPDTAETTMANHIIYFRDEALGLIMDGGGAG